jgi:Protein of unknown function (DUF1064).
MVVRLSNEELKRLGIKSPKSKKSKYRSNKVRADGIVFDSKAEANYYCILKGLLYAGKIDGFYIQPRFVVTEGRGEERCTEYVADFVIFYPNGTYRIVDVKGYETDVFKLKMKCLREKYPKLKIYLER